MEQRAFERADIEMQARLFHETGEIDGEVDNVSLYGLHMRPRSGRLESLQPGQPIEIHLDLTGGTSQLDIEIHGSVAYRDIDGVGVHIEQLGLDSFVHWRNVVSLATGDSDRLDVEFAEYLRSRQLVGRE